MRLYFLIISFLLSSLLQAQSMALEEYFPIKLFFANDEPNPRTEGQETRLTYSNTYQSYQNQFDKYLNKGEMFSYLLDGDIKPNFEKLEALKTTLVDSLNTGNRIVLTVKGYASPLHYSDYNVNISKRRISSFVNELNSNPQLKRFIETKQLILEELPFGEHSAHESVNDQLDSVHLSVHHMQASYERRVETELTTILNLNEPLLYAENAFLDAGKVKQGEKVNIVFTIKNLGIDTLKIDNIAVSCGCSIAETVLKDLQSEESTELVIEIDTKKLALGLQSKSITVRYNSGKSKRFVVLLELY